jgi:hypothetical protein
MSDDNEIDENDDWLASEIIECPHCQIKLLWLEHSPFENGYYFYCDSCPKRVDVSIYDPVFIEIEEGQKIKFEDLELWRKNYFENLMPLVEERLLPCDCGGNYRFKAVRRCLNCGVAVKEGDRNLWFSDFGKEPDGEQERLYRNLIIKEPKWE